MTRRLAFGERRFRTVWLSLILAVPLVASCTGSDGPIRRDPTPEDATNLASPRLPTVGEIETDPILLPERFFDEEQQIDLAYRSLLSTCMRTEGFEFYPPPPSTTLQRLLAMVPPDVEQRRRSGYSDLVVGTFDDSVAAENERSFGEALDGGGKAREGTTLNTPVGQLVASDGGCVGKARRALGGSVAEYLRGTQLAEDYRYVFDVEVQQDEQVAQARALWVICMEGEGYNTPNPRDLVRKFFVRVADRRDVSRSNIRAAVADAECQASSGLTTAIAAARVEVLGTLSNHDARMLKEYARARISILNRMIQAQQYLERISW